MDEQMIEDIARALHGAFGPFADYSYPWDDPLASKDMFRELARAAHSVMSERMAELMGLIRECRLADACAARTGDELRWDRAFHDLCRAERRAALAPHPKDHE